MAKRRMPQSDRSLFTRLSQQVAHCAGRPQTFMAAAALILIWALSGPFFGYNDTWQLVVNTSTTIVTFLMVFIIQNSQNRDTAAMQIKLDEDKLEAIRNEFEAMAAKARKRAATAADRSPV